MAQSPQSYRNRIWHGYDWGEESEEIWALLSAFARWDELSKKGWNLPKPETFWRICEILWPDIPGAKIIVGRNDWSERMVDALCQYQILGMSGCASSGKSFIAGAAWAVVNWLAWPTETVILVTSTTVQGSRKRVWKDISRLFQGAGGVGLNTVCPWLKLLDATAQCKIDPRKLADAGMPSEVVAGAGIEIIAGEPGKQAEASRKIQGIKARRVILVGDEFPHLGPGILETALGNLTSNPSFQLIALGNFKSMYDPFGIATEPTIGWKNLREDMHEWETKIGGVCLRFDGELSPNVIAGEDVVPGLYSNKIYQTHLRNGRTSRMFWEMCKSFPMPEGSELSIYSEADFVNGDVHGKVIWDEKPTRIAFLDPGFTNGGDRSMLVIADCAPVEGTRKLQFVTEIELQSDVTNKEVPHDFQIARKFRSECEKHGVAPENAGFDNTGAGISFGSIVHQVWSIRVKAIGFGGAPSDLPVSLADNETCRARYWNRVSELWVQGREYVRSGQIKGMSPALAKELLARQFPDPKLTGVSYKKVKVESKEDMKKRLNGMSPDLGDAALGTIEVARQSLNFHPLGYTVDADKKQQESEEIIQLVDAVNNDSCLLHETDVELVY